MLQAQLRALLTIMYYQGLCWCSMTQHPGCPMQLQAEVKKKTLIEPCAAEEANFFCNVQRSC